MGVLVNVFSFVSFLSGVVFGVALAVVAALHFLSAPPSFVEDLKAKFDAEREKSKAEDAIGKGSLGREEASQLTKIVDFLEEANAPLKNIAGVLQRIHLNKEHELGVLDSKMKTIIDYTALLRMEKEFQDNVAELKDHTKNLKLLASFLHDTGKTFNSISRDLSKLAHAARNNMNKNSSLDRKEDLIVNNWWQTLQVAMDHLASDHEDLATIVSVELINYSSQIQEEVTIIEKKLAAEGNKQFGLLKENIQLFEAKLRDREKNKEKMKTLTSSGGSDKEKDKDKRATKYKASEENLILQTKRLYEVQKEFYTTIPRISSDVQLTMLKSIVETQSQLFKFSEALDRAQQHNSYVTKRMRAQLTNAAASMVQMMREESKLLEETSNAPSDTSIALECMRQRLSDSGLAGYEISLQKVLEGLISQAQQSESDAAANALNRSNSGRSGSFVSGSGSAPDSPMLGRQNSSSSVSGAAQGKLNMFLEETACLAATNPTLLPVLPNAFVSSIGTETCVWLNAFTGRVYRDIASSKYFYRWFCDRLTLMLNKGEKERPAFIDRFTVLDVKFGDLPPLLNNVKWSPPSRADEQQTRRRGKAKSKADKGKRNGQQRGEDPEHDDFSSDSEGEEGELTMEGIEARTKDYPVTPEEVLYYAASTADVAFRSGIKMTVSTQLFLNWPRDRYVSVPVLLHLELSELCGRIRFGCTRAYSFVSFLHPPLSRISVRSEVGNEKYRLRDIPQVSEFIEKRLKAFIQRRFVYPHSHKFRLIWPRNWWPEGTEDLFVPQGGPVEVPSEGLTAATSKERDTVPVPSTEVPAPTKAHVTSKLSSWLSTSKTMPAQVAPAPSPSSTSHSTSATIPAVVVAVSNPQTSAAASGAAAGADFSRGRRRTDSLEKPPGAHAFAAMVNAVGSAAAAAAATSHTPPSRAPAGHGQTTRTAAASTPVRAPAPASLRSSEEKWRSFVTEHRGETSISDFAAALTDTDRRKLGHFFEASQIFAMSPASWDTARNHSEDDLVLTSTSNMGVITLRRSHSIGDLRTTTAGLAWDFLASSRSAHAYGERDSEGNFMAMDGSRMHLGTESGGDERNSMEGMRGAISLAGAPATAYRSHVSVSPSMLLDMHHDTAETHRESSRRKEEVRALLAKGKAQMVRASARLSAFKNKHLRRFSENEGHSGGVSTFLFPEDTNPASHGQRHQESIGADGIASANGAAAHAQSAGAQASHTLGPKRPSLTEGIASEASSAGGARKPEAPPTPSRIVTAGKPRSSFTGEADGAAQTTSSSSTSSAMKYVASMFRSASSSASSAAAADGSAEEKRRQSLLRAGSASAVSSGNNGGSSATSKAAAAPVAAPSTNTSTTTGGEEAASGTRMKDMFSKAFASVRQQMDKDT